MDKICAVMDLDGFTVRGEFLVREMGWIGIDWDEPISYRYDLSPYWHLATMSDLKTIRVVETKIMGMPFNPLPREDILPLSHLDAHIENLYDECSGGGRHLVAYKGGSYEKNRLRALGIPSINVEKFGCPTYERLHSDHYEDMTCGYHSRNKHCPRAEVAAFADWILDNM